MDEQFVKKLESRAYYAVVRALAASNKLNFDTETLLMDLQSALSLDDETAMNLVGQVEGDDEVTTLKAYDGSITKLPTAPSANLPALQAAKPAASRPSGAQAYQAEPAFNQPATKKQKKSVGSLPPPSTIARTPSVSPAVKPVAQTVTKPKARSASTTPQGAGPVAQRGSKAPRPTVSAASFSRVMQRSMPDEMESYLTELNIREREIFSELISQGVDENDPDLNELHRELIKWYKLDQRQTAIMQQLVLSS